MDTDVEKARFVEEFGDDYGYPNAPKNIDEIRATEFNRLQGNPTQQYALLYIFCIQSTLNSKYFLSCELSLLLSVGSLTCNLHNPILLELNICRAGLSGSCWCHFIL